MHTIQEQYKVNISSATLRDTSPEIRAMYEEAKKLFNEGKHDEANALYDKILDKGEETLTKAFEQIDGAEIKLDRTKGNYGGAEEPTFSGELKITNPKNRQEAFNALADFGAIHSQEAIHISKIHDNLPEGAELGKENEDGSVYEPNVEIRFDKPLSDAEYKDLSAVIQGVGEGDNKLAGSTLHPDKKGITLYNISKWKDHELFTDQIAELTQKLQNDGRVRPSVEHSVRQLWNYGDIEGAGGSTRTYQQLRDGHLPNTILPKEKVKEQAPLSGEKFTPHPESDVRVFSGSKKDGKPKVESAVKSWERIIEFPGDIISAVRKFANEGDPRANEILAIKGDQFAPSNQFISDKLSGQADAVKFGNKDRKGGNPGVEYFV